ncbi:Hydroxyethylthiazole kinase [Legionella massiliensis]|uniref:Hydroxyethylthiazole kinase n=1 Tax=Legionella massiliensis TaxID=1034943 RepID=A0A078KU76_9GAMM|nr:hydroxyethylthiazole kinase [Legionella massiliensis]CDZ77995.1 Hydroxyethylthiazole kinase [Legionella massiliensis]CEE13733.1 Hydroxyethylthiazole kinase [Legionella massiliensis]
MNLVKELEIALTSLRQSKPLVLCLTNVVTMDLMANSLLALGAAPLMSQARDELEELIAISQAVYINLGTLDQPFCERARYAASLAKQQHKTIILDPVGAGASRLRTEAAKSLLPFADIIRGNASEILALADEVGETKGVEASRTVDQAAFSAKKLAKTLRNVVVVSGPVDLVTDGTATIKLPFGSALMPLITGMGCTLTAVIAAFAGIGSNAYKDSLLATAYFGLCGQQSQQRTQEPGTFRQQFINALFKPDWAFFADYSNEISKMEIE